jgi:SSS family solute:Na+ symporter
VALAGFVALVPCPVLRFRGVGIIVETGSCGPTPSAAAIWIGAATVIGT